MIDSDVAERQTGTEKDVYAPFTPYEGPIMNEPNTETMKISDVRSNLNTLVNEVYRHEKRVIIEKSGIPVAAVVSLEDVRKLDQLQKNREEMFKVIDEMRAAFAGVPPEETEQMADQTVAEARAELRAERLANASKE